MKRFFAGGAAIALALSFSAVAAQASQLTAAEFEATHKGKCVSYSGPSAGTECFNADGTASYDDATYGSASGTWSMKGNDLCVKYSGSPMDCGPVMRSDAGFTDGSYTWVVN